MLRLQKNNKKNFKKSNLMQDMLKICRFKWIDLMLKKERNKKNQNNLKYQKKKPDKDKSRKINSKEDMKKSNKKLWTNT